MEKQKNVGADALKSAQNAITLVALVITVIILLILAGVTINLTLGNNGIFKTAQQAAKNYTEAQNKELADLNEFENTLEKVTQAPEYNPSLLKLKPGDYVKYDTGVKEVGDNGIATFRVLYDTTSEYGLQIISDKQMENVTLGGNDWATARDSYNNAIVTLNTEAEKYLNRTYATDVRCVGSNPANKNAENEGPVKLSFTSAVEGANNMKDIDINYATDENAMRVAEIIATGKAYWLASRYVHSTLTYYGFSNCFVNESGDPTYVDLCGVGVDSSSKWVSTLGLRPCIILKPDIKITSGDGASEATAYILGI